MASPVIAPLLKGLGSLTEYIDWTQYLTFGHSVVQSEVLGAFFSGKLGHAALVYTSDIMMLVAIYCASAYVVTNAVAAGVSTSRGFYANYSYGNQWANRVGLYEMVIVGGWIFWGMFQPIYGTYLAIKTWDAIDGRLEEAAADSTGLEEPLSGQLAIKSSTLNLLVGVILLIAGFSLGDMADEDITWYDQLDDNTKTEGTKPGGVSPDLIGTSAQQDLQFHFYTAFFSMFVFGIMNVGSYVFHDQFFNMGADNFKCDLNQVDASQYSGVPAIIAKITDRATCKANILDVFKIMNINGNNILERCEDAMFQHWFGKSDEEYALKFSSQYTREASLAICNEYPE